MRGLSHLRLSKLANSLKQLGSLSLYFVLFLSVAADAVLAQTGGEIFKRAACELLIQKVLTGDFGAMLTVIAGSLAILASTMGSFKGAWVLVFVSVGTFVFPATVEILFPGVCPGAGG